MKTLEQQISGRCKHFNGVMNERCKAGVAYKDIRSDDKPFRFPCIDRSFHNCSNAVFPSIADVEHELREINESTTRTIGVLMAIKKGRATSGIVPCSCGGNVHYVHAQLNGHVHAKCDSCGLSLME